MISALKGHHNVVSHLITCNADVNKKKLYGLTALHMASERGHMEVVKVLMKAHAKIDEVDINQSTPLMLAARGGHQDVVGHLILCSANVDKKNLRNQTALHIASERGHMEVVKVLLNVCVKIDEVDITQSTPLMLAAHKGHQDIVRHLIYSGASVDRKGNQYNQTALHYASERGNLGMVKVLLDAGAKIDEVDDHHITPLMLATHKEYAEVISYMLYAEMTKQDVSIQTIITGYKPPENTSHKVNIPQLPEHLHPKSQLGREVLLYAINQKYEQAAKVLIAKGVGIEGLLSTSPPMTALMLTAQKGYHASSTKELILQGVNINYQNPDGHTALHFAARSGRLGIVKILLNNEAEIDLSDKHHHTPLVLSVEAKKYDVMFHLITSGADVTRLAKHPD